MTNNYSSIYFKSHVYTRTWPDGMCCDPQLQATTSLNPRPLIPVTRNFMASLQFWLIIIISSEAVTTVKNSMILYDTVTFSLMVFESFFFPNTFLNHYSYADFREMISSEIYYCELMKIKVPCFGYLVILYRYTNETYAMKIGLNLILKLILRHRITNTTRNLYPRSLLFKEIKGTSANILFFSDPPTTWPLRTYYMPSAPTVWPRDTRSNAYNL